MSGFRPTPVFNLLSTLASDDEMRAVFSEYATIESWLNTEAALASAQARLGVIPSSARDAISEVAVTSNIDRERLWKESKVVGYPILPLVRQVDGLLPERHRGSLHFGATTQDIMDTGLALQLRTASRRLRRLLTSVGDEIASAAEEHRSSIMPGRTHAMHAVPTTWGAKLAVHLSEFTSHLQRLESVQEQVSTVSLYGAGGTSAAYGPRSVETRRLTAELLDLHTDDVPWHVARGRLAEWGQLCVSLTASTARLAREVIDLSRNEIGEVTERNGHHRGASSTMPQKRNPITSETLVGNSIVAGSLASALPRIMEAGHERAAGEWQAEWFVLPHLAALAGSSLSAAADLVSGLNVDPAAMRRNLRLDHGLIMAEAYMIGLAPALGRERAHEVVYEAAGRAREQDVPLEQALRACVAPEHREQLTSVEPTDHLGEADAVVTRAAAAWRTARAGAGRDD